MADNHGTLLRTPIVIQQRTRTYDAEGYPSDTWADVLSPCWCQWSPLVGSDDTAGDQLGAVEEVNVLIRACSSVTATCRVLKWGDSDPYEIAGPVVDNGGGWMTFRARRKVAGV